MTFLDTVIDVQKTWNIPQRRVWSIFLQMIKNVVGATWNFGTFDFTLEGHLNFRTAGECFAPFISALAKQSKISFHDSALFSCVLRIERTWVQKNNVFSYIILKNIYLLKYEIFKNIQLNFIWALHMVTFKKKWPFWTQ